MAKTIDRESVTFDVDDNDGVLYAVERAKNGKLTACVRVVGRVEIDGIAYEYDRHVRVGLKRQ